MNCLISYLIKEQSNSMLNLFYDKVALDTLIEYHKIT